MLPITRQRVLQIPHGLATVAAGICLVLAFTTDIQSRHDRIAAERAESVPVYQLAASDEARPDSLPRPDKRPRDTSARYMPLSLFPWFPGLGSNGG